MNRALNLNSVDESCWNAAWQRALTSAALAAAVCIAISAGLSSAAAAPTEIASFGDSLSDVGNLYLDSGRTVPSPPYFAGRFSNGPVWVERLAANLNLPAPAPSLSGGANYAWGGAETGSGLSFYETLNVGTQIDLYLGSHTPANTTLFTVWAGANDLFVHQSDPAPIVTDLSGHISTLAAAGGRHFLVGNLPPLGKFPSVLGTPASPLLDAFSVQFNGLLASELDKLQSSLGVTIYRLDAYNIYQSILANPGAYGLTNVTKPAFNDITVVPNPDQYLFWDGDHPTRVVSQLLGDAAAALVPAAAGDFNNDGSVDAADYVVWRNGLGTIYTQSDYDTWRANFGECNSCWNRQRRGRVLSGCLRRTAARVCAGAGFMGPCMSRLHDDFETPNVKVCEILLRSVVTIESGFRLQSI